MSYATDELNELQKEITRRNPSDVLQFCFDHFSKKLGQQRSHCWQIKDEAELKGLDLFPKAEASHSTLDQEPSFKSPFSGSDPHLNHAHSEVHSAIFKGHGAVDFGGHANSKVSESVEPADSGKASGSTQLPQQKIPVAFNVNRRSSVSSEAMDPDKFRWDSWKPPSNNLSAAQKEELAKTLASNFLFRQLDENSKKTVLSALTKKVFNKGDVIIKQGDEGDFFYIIESGTVDFYVNGNQVNSSSEGSSFGELALMYNSPRAATALAVSEDGVTCWALDRLTFRRILLEGTFNRRLMYEDFLKDVKVLAGLSAHERLKLADALTTEIYPRGSKIVKEGERGENFYFIESGNCNVKKEGKGVVATLSKGDYFGEVALLNDLPRQATVEAADNVIVATLGKSGFTRLLGPAVDVLKRQDPTAH